MRIVCLDLEGVLVPEIWVAFAEKTGVDELTRTTRDEPDYEVLMHYRLEILNKHGFSLSQIQDVIESLDPLPGALDFLDELRSKYELIILSDTFREFAGPLMKKLNFEVVAAGDSYNDLGMLKTADYCMLFSPPEQLVQEYPDIKVCRDYPSLLSFIESPNS